MIAVCWIAWVLIWIVTAVIFRPDSRDASPRGDSRSRRYWLRLLLAAFFVVALRADHPGGASFDAALGWLGVALCATGIGIATWARVCLGPNWGMPMTQRAEPELVTSGPHRFVRHPIYSGLLTAMLGTALADNLLGLIVVVVLVAYFYVCGIVEERNLTATFPTAYPEYKSRTKMLIPFLL